METTPGNAVDLLVDDEMAEAVAAAVRRARRRVDLSQLLFFPEFVARFRRQGVDARPLPEGPLLDAFLDAGRRGAQVRILLNENTIIPDTLGELRLACADAPNVEVRGLPLAINLLHAKVLVVDDEEAILVGPPFEQRFWDTRRHDLREPRREDKPPMHDVSLRLRGPAVAEVARFFDALWGDERPRAPSPPSVAPGRTSVGIVRTLPRGLFDAQGERGILRAYLDAMGRARSFVYLETQYLTSGTIVRALRDALDREPELQAILVVNEHMDIPGYDRWQEDRAKELGYPEHPRVGMFRLASPRRAGGETRSVYVHSKLAVVDDEWATVGSANLDSISLEEADEFGIRSEPNVDLNAVVLDPDWVASARRRVWAEHLGDKGVWRADPPPGGWLALWRRCAHANAEKLGAGRAMRGFVLPYGPEQVIRS